jgi:hypothetical protein
VLFSPMPHDAHYSVWSKMLYDARRHATRRSAFVRFPSCKPERNGLQLYDAVAVNKRVATQSHSLLWRTLHRICSDHKLNALRPQNR